MKNKQIKTAADLFLAEFAIAEGPLDVPQPEGRLRDA